MGECIPASPWSSFRARLSRWMEAKWTCFVITEGCRLFESQMFSFGWSVYTPASSLSDPACQGDGSKVDMFCYHGRMQVVREPVWLFIWMKCIHPAALSSADPACQAHWSQNGHVCFNGRMQVVWDPVWLFIWMKCIHPAALSSADPACQAHWAQNGHVCFNGRMQVVWDPVWLFIWMKCIHPAALSSADPACQAHWAQNGHVCYNGRMQVVWDAGFVCRFRMGEGRSIPASPWSSGDTACQARAIPKATCQTGNGNMIIVLNTCRIASGRSFWGFACQAQGLKMEMLNFKPIHWEGWFNRQLCGLYDCSM